MKGYTGHLKQRILNKNVMLQGCVMDCRSGSVIEMYHEIGFDAVLIDREHAPFDLETVLEHIRLARILEFPVMVRVSEISYAEINRIMDQAPDGIYVPRIRSRQEVEEVIRLAKFPPRGVKGFGASTCPAGKYVGWKPDSIKQLEFYNDQFVIGIQIETREALADLDGILSVPGVDIAVIGNDDLSLGMGIPGEFDNPEYHATIEKIIAACEKHHVLPGIACDDPKKIRYWKDRGMRVFWAAADIVSMWTFTQQIHDAIRQELQGS